MKKTPALTLMVALGAILEPPAYAQFFDPDMFSIRVIGGYAVSANTPSSDSAVAGFAIAKQSGNMEVKRARLATCETKMDGNKIRGRPCAKTDAGAF